MPAEVTSLGWRALEEGRPADAMELMKLGVEVDSRNPDSYSGLAAVLGASGVDSPPGRYQFRGLILEGQIDAAVEVFDRTRDRYPEWILFSEGDLNDLGYALLGAGRLSDAIKLFETAATAYSDSANVFDSLGEAYRQAGREAEAERAYKGAADLSGSGKDR